MNVTDRLPGNRCDSWIGALAVLFLGVFVFPTLAFSQNTITLPIEVYPDDGRSSHVESVTINASNGSAANRVFFQMHQPFYHKGGWETNPSAGFDPEQMVDVRLNGGSWVTVRNSNVTCAEPGESLGCIAGAFSTLRFAMDASDLGGAVDGANTLEFRFNGTEGVRSGFRVLAVGFMRSSDDLNRFVPLPKSGSSDTVIDGTTFQLADPDTWEAPSGFGDSQSISEGEALWSAENSLEDIDGSSMVAACASCHAGDGRDLQYFAYSNNTIVSRSQAHGLSETEGKKIAAYIRSLSFDHADGGSATTNSPGRPWNPPYQPGPSGFGPDGDEHPDEADPFYWAAGAGLDWVLERDIETLPHIFPASGDPANPQGLNVLADGSLPWTRYRITNTSEWGSPNSPDRGTAVNMREIPLSVQFPDWNNWLPDVHPHDGLEKLFDGSDVESHFDNGESVFQGGDLQEVDTWIDQTNGKYFTNIKSNVKNRLNDPSIGTSNPLTQNQWVHAIQGGVLWRAVKTWYLQHKYQMEDKADDLQCNGAPEQWCEPLGWMGSARTLFDLGPHVSGTDVNTAPFVYGTIGNSTWYSHIWYQIQMVVNPGTDGNTGQVPVDEGYQEAFMEGGSRYYPVGAGIRQTMSEWKLYQMYANSINDRKGMIPGNSKIGAVLHVVSDGWRKNKIWDLTYSNASEFRDIERLFESFIRASNAYMVGENGSEGRIATIQRLNGSGYDNQGFTWNGIEYDPVIDRLPSDKDYASQIYNTLNGSFIAQDEPLADFFPNMSRGAIDSLAAQGDLLTPDNRDDGYTGEVVNGWSTDGPRWHDLVDYTPPSTGSQTIGLAQGWNLISSRINPSDPAIESVFAGVDSDLSLVKNEAGDIYSPGVGLNNIGDWQSREGYLVYMTNSQSMSVSGYGVDPTTSFMLEEGWNLIPYYPDAGMTPEDAFASISSELVLVKNQAGETYVPDPQDPIDDIGQLQPGEAYKIYVSSPVSFSYPSN
jgi:cytochrome c553